MPPKWVLSLMLETPVARVKVRSSLQRNTPFAAGKKGESSTVSMVPGLACPTLGLPGFTVSQCSGLHPQDPHPPFLPTSHSGTQAVLGTWVESVPHSPGVHSCDRLGGAAPVQQTGFYILELQLGWSGVLSVLPPGPPSPPMYMTRHKQKGGGQILSPAI